MKTELSNTACDEVVDKVTTASMRIRRVPRKPGAISFHLFDPRGYGSRRVDASDDLPPSDVDVIDQTP